MHRSWMAVALDGKSYDAREMLYRAILRYRVILDQCSLSAALLLFQLVVDKAQSKRSRSSAWVGFTSAQRRLSAVEAAPWKRRWTEDLRRWPPRDFSTHECYLASHARGNNSAPRQKVGAVPIENLVWRITASCGASLHVIHFKRALNSGEVHATTK